MWNGLSCWMVTQNGWLKTKRRNNRSPAFRPKVILPHTTDFEVTLKRILERHRIQTIFKPITKLSTVLSSGKAIVPAGIRQGVVYEIPCGNCEQKYWGETKRSLSTPLKEHHRDTLPRNILKNPYKTALTKDAAQSSHGFNWDCAHVLHHENSFCALKFPLIGICYKSSELQPKHPAS